MPLISATFNSPPEFAEKALSLQNSLGTAEEKSPNSEGVTGDGCEHQRNLKTSAGATGRRDSGGIFSSSKIFSAIKESATHQCYELGKKIRKKEEIISDFGLDYVFEQHFQGCFQVPSHSQELNH